VEPLPLKTQVLRFYGFFQETVTERPDENARYRHVSIMFHMEDGTMSMHEPKVGWRVPRVPRVPRIPKFGGMAKKYIYD
jgi:hypothetical protein